MASTRKQAAMGTRMGESTVPAALSYAFLELSGRLASGVLLPPLEGMRDDGNRLGDRGQNSRVIMQTEKCSWPDCRVKLKGWLYT
jgi:hypothetical protein